MAFRLRSGINSQADFMRLWLLFPSVRGRQQERLHWLTGLHPPLALITADLVTNDQNLAVDARNGFL